MLPNNVFQTSRAIAAAVDQMAAPARAITAAVDRMMAPLRAVRMACTFDVPTLPNPMEMK